MDTYLSKDLGHGEVSSPVAGSGSNRDVDPVDSHACHTRSLGGSVWFDVTGNIKIVFLAGRGQRCILDQAEYGGGAVHWVVVTSWVKRVWRGCQPR